MSKKALSNGQRACHRAMLEHDFMRLKFSHAGLDYAYALTEHEPYPGKSKPKCIEALDAVWRRR